MTSDQRWVQATDGSRLFVRGASVENPQADVLITHGLGEHSGRYRHMIELFNRFGFQAWAHDLRGHGRSEGARGDAKSIRLLTEDLSRVVDQVWTGRRPFFLVGHSMGGQILLNYLLAAGSERFSGAVAMSPWLRLAFDPPLWRLLLGRAALLLCPRFAQRTPHTPDRLSRDQEHWSRLQEPELVHHWISARLFFSVKEGGNRVLREAGRIQSPLLLLHGEADSVTSAEATRELFHRVGSADKTLLTYADGCHELHNDLCREEALRDICEWISGRIGSAKGASAQIIAGLGDGS